MRARRAAPRAVAGFAAPARGMRGDSLQRRLQRGAAFPGSAAEIPKARFEVMPGEAHQPFQEALNDFNSRVDAFRREVEARG
jgi:pimeloyl-ACP methyl ester carboxylesterase